MQLVISGKRILTYGENFIAMGNVVVNPETGAKYNNATIAESACVPSDIDEVGYEYHAGEFIPCAPFGKGDGTVPVLCGNDCKAIKDSGIPIASVCIIEQQTYKGNNGSSEHTLEFKYPPFFLYINSVNVAGVCVFIQGGQGVSIGGSSINSFTTESSGTTITIPKTIANNGVNTYQVTAFCLRG